MHRDLDPERPGRERARLLGGEGTPQVCEFAAADLGARIGRSPYAAAQLMADALDPHYRVWRTAPRLGLTAAETSIGPTMAADELGAAAYGFAGI